MSLLAINNLFHGEEVWVVRLLLPEAELVGDIVLAPPAYTAGQLRLSVSREGHEW